MSRLAKITNAFTRKMTTAEEIEALHFLTGFGIGAASTACAWAISEFTDLANGPMSWRDGLGIGVIGIAMAYFSMRAIGKKKGAA